MSLIKELQHLQIPLKEINLATKNFDKDNFIGLGAFGKVFQAELSLSNGPTVVAIKRLDSTSRQGDHEFLTEIAMLTNYKHDNLVRLLGFCDESGERILVYEYMNRGSLDKYLSSNGSLTWLQRLKICVDGARGLDYLHNRVGEQFRVIHRDIKSSNILLGEDWQAKISDFGLSKIGPANQQITYVISNACGTLGYCDPSYIQTGLLTKESDVYSFGVVLFEVLCGRRALIAGYEDERRILAHLAKLRFQQKRLGEVIDPNLEDQIDPHCLDEFTKIGYRCLDDKREDRPSMDLVLKALEKALEFQESYELHKKWSFDYGEINRISDSPALYSTKEELHDHLSKGILLDGGKKWLSLSKTGENTEMISAIEFSYERPVKWTWITVPGSRFPTVASVSKYYAAFLKIQAKLRTEYLSPGVTYAAYLVLKFSMSEHSKKQLIVGEPTYTEVKYMLADVNQRAIAELADWSEREYWMMVELFQFVNYKKNAEFEVQIYGIELIGHYCEHVIIEGIEFKPIEKVKEGGPKRLEDEITNNSMLTSDLDTDWEQKLPVDAPEIIKGSNYDQHYTMNKDLYHLLCTGILINDKFPKWFWLQNGKKCHMQDASMMRLINHSREDDGQRIWRKSIQQSRFGYGFKVYQASRMAPSVNYQLGFSIHGSIIAQMMSTNTRYACYLVYKLPKDPRLLAHPWRLNITVSNKVIGSRVLCLVAPQSLMMGPRNDQVHYIPLNRPKIEGLPNQRKNRWMEVLFWEFIYGEVDIVHILPSTTTTTAITGDNPFEMTLSSLYTANPGVGIGGFVVEGIEFRPI